MIAADQPNHMPDANVFTIGRVLHPQGDVLYRVALPNGKVINAHLSKALSQAGAVFQEQDRLLLEMTPYDFEQARIIRLEPT